MAIKFADRGAAHPNFCVIAAGDLVERKKNGSGPVNFIRRQMEILENGGEVHGLAASIPSWYVQGQHDMQKSPWPNASHRWPSHLPTDQEQYERHRFGDCLLGDYKVWAMDWTPPDLLAEELAKVPKDTDILIMHQVCSHFMGDITTPELSFEQIPHAKLLIVGDYHKHVKFETRGAQGQKLTVLSPGSTNLREITEERDKRVFILYEDLSVKSARIPTRVVIEPMDLLGEESVEDLLDELDSLLDAAEVEATRKKLSPEIRMPILYVRYHRRLAGTEPRLLRALKKRAHLFTKPIGRVTEDGEEEVDAEFDASEVALTLLGCLPEEVDLDKEPELFQGLQRLLSTDEPGVELSKMRAEFLDRPKKLPRVPV